MLVLMVVGLSRTGRFVARRHWSRRTDDGNGDSARRGESIGDVRVEEFFEDGKGDFGMADYESRSWTSWHHHMSLVALAHLYVTLTKGEMNRQIPDLTLDMAVRVLRSAFARGELTEEDAIRIVEYHRRRNRIASKSHRKSWLRKHKNVKPKVLL